MNYSDRSEIGKRKQICMNALLNRPWIDKKKDAEIYYWIKDQYLEIKDWFIHYAGYSIILNRNFIKLEKVPTIALPWMGFQEFREPLDYSLFAYSLWYLENKTEGEQFLLTQLVIEIRQYMIEQGMDVNWANYYHRLSMARALKKLKNLNVVQAVDGEESNWASNYENYDVLYECTIYSRYILRNFPTELSNYTSIDELKETMFYGNDSKEIEMRDRHDLYRRFLLEPVVLNHHWHGNLPYLENEANFLIKNLKAMFGWEGSRYREGILFFEADSISGSEIFPTQLALSDLAMLLCGEVRILLMNDTLDAKVDLNGLLRLTKNEIERLLIHLKERFGEFWTNEHKKMNSSSLAEEICEHLSEWGFGHWEDHMFFVINGAGGRWEVEYGATEQVD